MSSSRFSSVMAGLAMLLFTVLAHGQLTISGETGAAASESSPAQESVQPAPVPTPDPAPPGPLITSPNSGEPLADQVEALKEAVLDLNRDLLILEEELLYPANTQIAVFVSMDVGEFFQLDAVELKIDDNVVASSLYTPQQADALFRGGMQRLFLGNLKSGSHVVTAFFVGKGPEGREYKRGATLVVEKELAPKMLELRITDSTRKLQPVFDIKEWEL